MSIRILPEEISIWTGNLSKHCFHQWKWASSNLLRVQIKQKGSKKANLLLLLRLRSLSPSDIGSPGSQAFGLGLGLIPSTPWFSALQTQTMTYTIVFHGSQGFQFGLELHHQLSWSSSLHISQSPKSCELISHNKSLSLYLYISYWFCFSGELWLIHQSTCYSLNHCHTFPPTLLTSIFQKSSQLSIIMD